MDKKKTSIVWNFFTKKDRDEAVCNICQNKFAYKSSSSNLKKHLERKHPTISLSHLDDSKRARSSSSSRPATSGNNPTEVHNNAQNKNAAKEVTAFESSNDQVPNTSQSLQQQTSHTNITQFLKRKLPLSSKKMIDNHLMELFTKDFQPFRIVEDEGFRRYSQAMNPNYTLPSRKTISQTYLPAAYEQAKNRIRELYSTNKIISVTLTTDCWTSTNNESFMAVTAHYVDSDFQLKSNVLECCAFAETHTSENLALELDRVANEWNVANKLLLCISDNAPNIVKAIKDVLQWKHFGCLAHTINLVVKGSIEDERNENIRSLIQKIKSVVTHFKLSGKSNNKLMEIQKQIGLVPKKLINDVVTRWNSTFDMIQRFVELETSLRSTIALLDKDVEVLSSDEWMLANKIKTALEPLKELTDFISGEKYVSASSVIVVVQGILEEYKELKKNNLPNAYIYSFIESLEKGINNRLGNLESSRTFTISTFLDPRFKNIFFFKEKTADQVKKTIIDLVEKEIASETPSQPMQPSSSLSSTNESSTSSTSSSLWKSFERISSSYKPVGTSRSRAIAEVGRYVEEPLLDRHENPLNWWREQGYNFPYLQKFVRKHFCPIVTSVPCERIFSRAGQILNDRRTRLSSDKVKKLVFLNYNS